MPEALNERPTSSRYLHTYIVLLLLYLPNNEYSFAAYLGTYRERFDCLGIVCEGKDTQLVYLILLLGLHILGILSKLSYNCFAISLSWI